MTTDPKAGPSVVRARVPLVDKAAATPAPLAVWDRIAQSRGRAAGPFAVLARKAGVRDEVISALNAFGAEPTPAELLLPV